MAMFYTKSGDKGASCIGKTCVSKSHELIGLLGELDELNSFIGLSRSYSESARVRRVLLALQEHLFIIQAHIAYLLYPKITPPVFSVEKVSFLEKEIDAIEKGIKVQKSFIIPGSCKEAAWLDVARTLARKVERSYISETKNKKMNKDIAPYLNRLSSMLYALARYSASVKKVKEKGPTYR